MITETKAKAVTIGFIVAIFALRPEVKSTLVLDMSGFKAKMTARNSIQDFYRTTIIKDKIC